MADTKSSWLEAGPLVRVRDATLRRGRHTLLESVDLDVKANEITTIIGPNGAGKTTLLKIILGLLEPSSGHVTRRAGLRVGYLPQKLQLDPVLPITVARLMTLTVRRSRAAVIAALGETGIAARVAGVPVQSHSGGELQRVLLARALIIDPDLLVLDEPVQGVDFAGEAALYDLISEARRHRRCSVVMVSHDLHVVMAATDRVVCLSRHICCAGTAAAVGRDPEYVRLFGAKAASALAVYAHHHDHAHTTAGQVVPLSDKMSDALHEHQNGDGDAG